MPTLIVIPGLVTGGSGTASVATAARSVFGDVGCGSGTGVGHDDGEFFAAVAGDEVDVAGTALQLVGDVLQAFVAGGVPVSVVEEFEVVDVDHRQGDRAVGALRMPPFDVEDVFESASIGQAGEGIGDAEYFEAGVGDREFVGALGDFVFQRCVDARRCRGTRRVGRR